MKNLGHKSIEIREPKFFAANTVLDSNLSIYLDLLRLLASVQVVLGHARHFVMPKLPGFISGHTAEAVAIFFVLSGFVIKYVSDEKEKTVQSYLSARTARLISVCLISLIATFIFDFVGRSVNPAIYQNFEFYNENYIGSFLRSLTFTNEIWFSHVVTGTNEPYWSLGFEFAYYCIFAAAFYFKGIIRIILTSTLIIVFGPKIILYLPLWLMGTFLYTAISRNRINVPRTIAIIAFILSIALYLVTKRALEIWAFPMFEFELSTKIIRSFIYFMAIGLIVSLNIYSFKFVFLNKIAFPTRVRSTIRWLAGASFTLYLTHQPFLIMIYAIFPDVKNSNIMGLCAIVACFITSLLIAEIGERRKSSFHKFTNIVFYRIKFQ